ncbi:MAG: hemerythrin domain-containing protein [Rhizobiaceae bacterium]
MKPSSGKSGSSQIRADLAELAERLSWHISMQSSLCGRLEEFADSLPAGIETRECVLLARCILPVLKRAHQFEEKTLYPAINNAFENDIEIARTIERLRFEHWEDESYADELGERLKELISDPEKCNVESLAYMLRGFFEGLRRHLAFEREHLLPLLTGETS